MANGNGKPPKPYEPNPKDKPPPPNRPRDPNEQGNGKKPGK